MFGSKESPAKRRYLQGSLSVMACYIAFVCVARVLVNHLHPVGWQLMAVAALPTLPLITFAWIVGRYLREEHDDYQRDVVIRGMLWGTAAALSISIFESFLRSYGWTGSFPPFIEFMVFWVVVAIVKFAYSISNRVGADE